MVIFIVFRNSFIKHSIILFSGIISRSYKWWNSSVDSRLCSEHIQGLCVPCCVGPKWTVVGVPCHMTGKGEEIPDGCRWHYGLYVSVADILGTDSWLVHNADWNNIEGGCCVDGWKLLFTQLKIFQNSYYKQHMLLLRFNVVLVLLNLQYFAFIKDKAALKAVFANTMFGIFTTWLFLTLVDELNISDK